jgi:predicted TIM-barrel fold metal-dependent hydrolase
LVLDTIAVFGVERCLFAYNFPVGKLVSDYDAIWRDHSGCRWKLFHDKAAHVYDWVSRRDGA